MNRHSFRIQLIARTLLILVSSVLLAFVLFKTNLLIIPILLSCVVVAQIAGCLWYVDRSNRDLKQFLSAVRHEDFVTGFSTRERGASFEEVYAEFDRIAMMFQNMQAEKAIQYQLLQQLIDHVDVGLVCFTESAEFKIINRAFLQMLQKPYIPNMAHLEPLFPVLHHSLTTISPGGKDLIELSTGEKKLEIALRATSFVLRGEKHTLVSLQNIEEELEARDMEAWQKLIRILTHEIMNSVTPILSLTDTLMEMNAEWEAVQVSEPLEEYAQDMREGLSAIQTRGKGLMHFTKAYRDLTRLPKPQLQATSIQDFIEQVHRLMKPVCEANGISFQLEIQVPNRVINIDPDLMEQVFINLIQNAIDAQQEQETGEITLHALELKEGVQFTLHDRGPGLTEAIQERMFIPFYTTREKGSGIGLSLSRQIVLMHRGRLSAQNRTGGGASFSISLPFPVLQPAS